MPELAPDHLSEGGHAGPLSSRVWREVWHGIAEEDRVRRQAGLSSAELDATFADLFDRACKHKDAEEEDEEDRRQAKPAATCSAIYQLNQEGVTPQGCAGSIISTQLPNFLEAVVTARGLMENALEQAMEGAVEEAEHGEVPCDGKEVWLGASGSQAQAAAMKNQRINDAVCRLHTKIKMLTCLKM